MAHKRSKKAQRRRWVSRLISYNAHRDDENKQESINTLTPRKIRKACLNVFGRIDEDIIRHIHQGEVLTDSRGNGSLQQIGVVI